MTSHDSFLSYKGGRWWKIAGLLCLVSLLAYIFAPLPAQHFGGTWLGYTLGTIGAGLIVWLTLLGVRKRAMTPGTWSLKAWTSAHVYLGLSLIVVATLHTGFDLGWNVHTLAWGLMMLVIASGMVGIWFYWALPQAMSQNRYDEDGAVTEKQMIEQLRSIDRQIHDAAQPLSPEDAAVVDRSLEQDPFDGSVWNRMTGRYANCETRRAAATLREARAFRPRVADDPLDRVDALLSRKEAMLARLRRHLRLKSLLQVWLYVHVPTTFALLAALSAHIVSVFFYW
ncbi:hypothetical protein AB433_00140 [Croceicoccus naphthovorans]|uniref:Ferric reductase like transmembrane component n=1 Tax=Croceicoccus naphthovorans TaxID=1348774 RepID=A0A0G3XLP8_9SPHN|nr:hypothetical protein AB433_00140 [Croceicoccus naphthovorans]